MLSVEYKQDKQYAEFVAEVAQEAEEHEKSGYQAEFLTYDNC